MEDGEEKPSKFCKGGGFVLQCSLSAMLIALAGTAVFAAFGEDTVVNSINLNQTFLRGGSAQPAHHAVNNASRVSRPRTLVFVKMEGNVTLRARPTEPPATQFVPSFVQPQVNPVSDRTSTSRKVCAFPSFFLMGAQKCASTSLNELLTTVVPEIRSYKSKETHYLDRASFKNKNFYEGNLAGKYAKSRGKKGGKDFCFSVKGRRGGYIDSTPDYLTKPPDGPRRLKSVVPDGVDASTLKFLVVLREPVLRQISLMNMRLRNACNPNMAGKKLPRNQCNFETQKRQFEETLKELASARVNEATTDDQGMYAIGLKRWWSLWDRKQFLIMNYRDVVYNTSATLQRLSSFLGVDGSTLEGKPLPHKNTAGQLQIKISDISCSVIKQYHDLHAPYVERLYKMLAETAHQAPPEQTPFKEFENPLEMCRKD